MRHAEAGNARNDRERDLTAVGRGQAESMGLWLRENASMPDRIYSSPAKRARMTAELCFATAGYQGSILLEENLYTMNGDAYMDLLDGMRAHCDSVIIVGHNPEISSAVTIFTGEQIIMPPCSLACIEFTAIQWRNCLGTLRWFRIPGAVSPKST